MGSQQKKKSVWKKIAGIVLLIQLGCSAMAIGTLIWINMLPEKYVALAGLILVWLLTFVYYLFYSGNKKKKGKKTTTRAKKRKLYTKRSIGSVISAITIAVCLIGSTMVIKTGGTIQNIADNVTVTDTVSVYALSENPAQTVSDVKDGVFAITLNYDYEHTQKVLEQMNDELGQSVRTQSYDTMFDMIDALYAGNVDAIIMNAAYVDVVEGQKGYEDFSQKTKVLLDHEVQTVVEAEHD